MSDRSVPPNSTPPVGRPAPGEAPAGTDQDPRRIRAMFEGIAGSYDFLNHFFSLSIDRIWRRAMAREIVAGGPVLRALDVATGTGDLARAIARRAPDASVVGLDFTSGMIVRARRKYGAGRFAWIEGDALRLPFDDATFDCCTVGFGLRNMTDRDAALREMARVVRPGGRVGVLEFSQPTNPVVRRFERIYSHGVMPTLGRWISGSDAYRYLPESITTFPAPAELKARMEAAGLREVRYRALSGGIAWMHVGRAGEPTA